MHIPDHYLSPSTCVALTVATVPAWVASYRKVKSEIPKTKLSALSIGAAISFLLMMFNVPLPGGTTGHAVGGVLLAILFGPYAACISMTLSLLVQAVLFGDGGILAFGANCFNMAFVMPFVGHYVYTLLKGNTASTKINNMAAGISAYVGINIAALLTSVELGIQPYLFSDSTGLAMYNPFSLAVSVPAMMIPHLIVVGLIEGLVTVGILSFVKAKSPEIMLQEEVKVKGTSAIWFLLMVMALLTPLGLLAKGEAFGEWAVADIAKLTEGGYTPVGMLNGFQLDYLLPDYTLSAIPQIPAYLLSSAIGVGCLILFSKVVSVRRNSKA